MKRKMDPEIIKTIATAIIVALLIGSSLVSAFIIRSDERATGKVIITTLSHGKKAVKAAADTIPATSGPEQYQVKL